MTLIYPACLAICYFCFQLNCKHNLGLETYFFFFPLAAPSSGLMWISGPKSGLGLCTRPPENSRNPLFCLHFIFGKVLTIHQNSNMMTLDVRENTCQKHLAFFFVWFFFFFCLFRAAPTAYGSSQARGQIGAAAAGLHHSHSNMVPELCMQ